MSNFISIFPLFLRNLRSFLTASIIRRKNIIFGILSNYPFVVVPKAFPLLYIVHKSKILPLPSNFETEQLIAQLIIKVEDLIIAKNTKEAKIQLDNAMKIAERDQAYGSIAHLCDLQAMIAFIEGGVTEAENSLVNSIEKLLQLGFTEDQNSIVRFKLKLARLYQIMGIYELAELGYQDCIRVQEEKLKSGYKYEGDSIEFSVINDIYMSALFWYGKLLQDFEHYQEAKMQYKKCLQRMLLVDNNTPNFGRHNLTPSQKMVLLFNLAEVVSQLKEYDEALGYLFDAIEICLKYVPDNSELPLYIIEVGKLFTKKGAYEGGRYWCETGLSIATKENNAEARKQGLDCLNRLDEIQGKKKSVESSKTV